ncbi:MAG: CDP-glucose 4,6-dehydratase [Erysipelotrichaceae bacterium]
MQDFYRGKKVLITGHTGFKGSWLSKILIQMGADVVGYSLDPLTDPNLFSIIDLKKQMKSIIGDIRDLNHLKKVFNDEKPEIIFHLAAQPIVLDSYKNPVYTYETNVIGTVNLMECIRLNQCVKSAVNITTDKVYQNNEWCWGYRENDRLCGFDPYSNSKSCSELVTYSYKHSFFKDRDIAISTVRAGNVIGGGDFSPNRIIPDCIRAATIGKTIEVRNPNSIRPYQHVLEPLYCYMMIAKQQYIDKNFAGEYNIGPNDSDCITTGMLAAIFTEKWGEKSSWKAIDVNGPHEANFLKLDCSKLKQAFNWKPKWNVEEAIEKTVEWSKAYENNENMNQVMNEQIKIFMIIKKNEQSKIIAKEKTYE